MSRHPTLNNIRFSKWIPIQKIFDDPKSFKVPGVYLIARTSKEISKQGTPTFEKIVYIGMSNNSVYSRLKYFNKEKYESTSIETPKNSTKKRVSFLKNANSSSIYVSVFLSELSFPKHDKVLSTRQIRELGRIQYIEKDAIAKFLQKNKVIPGLDTNIRE